jgi:hypothetical protein
VIKTRSVLLTKYLAGHQIEKNAMNRACSAYGTEERFIQGFGGEIDHLEDPDVDGRIVLK